ncbi:MAG: hypothetical protein MR037_00920, partial [Bacteroidales bacterium]|nr:hypothetical protein [Bacteroidales bacterium]
HNLRYAKHGLGDRIYGLGDGFYGRPNRKPAFGGEKKASGRETFTLAFAKIQQKMPKCKWPFSPTFRK